MSHKEFVVKVSGQVRGCMVMQIAHPTFLSWTLPAMEEPQVRLAHARPAYENVSLHGDVFSQVSILFTPCISTCNASVTVWETSTLTR